MEFFAEVDKEASAWDTKGRNIMFSIAKKDVDAEYWPRITKDKVKNAKITTDWSKWVDEDDEADEGDKGMDGFDPSMMNQFGGGGMPGMGGGMPGMPNNMSMMNMGGPGGMDMA